MLTRPLACALQWRDQRSCSDGQLFCAWLRLARTDEGFCTQPCRRCVPLTQAGGPFAEYWTMFGGLFFSQLGSSRDKGCVPWRSRQIPTLHRWPCALFGTKTSKCFKTEIGSCSYVHENKVKFFLICATSSTILADLMVGTTSFVLSVGSYSTLFDYFIRRRRISLVPQGRAQF